MVHTSTGLSQFQPTSPVRETTGTPGQTPAGSWRFQPTSPVRETTWACCLYTYRRKPFQPTSPVRETTGLSAVFLKTANYFNPRPPCGRRLFLYFLGKYELPISTHVPRAGDDIQRLSWKFWCGNFNPRPPCGRRPTAPQDSGTSYIFQPTSPVRETTLLSGISFTSYKTFQPTSPVRETTCRCDCGRPIILISTHVPRAGDDIYPIYYGPVRR